MADPVVSELHAVKFDNCLLRQQLLAQQHAAVVAEQQALLAEMRASVNAGPEDRYDPKSRTFVKPPQAVTRPAREPRAPKAASGA